jgi:hypothetical protein
MLPARNFRQETVHRALIIVKKEFLIKNMAVLVEELLISVAHKPRMCGTQLTNPSKMVY